MGAASGLREFIADHHDRIADHWFRLVAETYPPETAAFLKDRNDGIANPVGYTIRDTVTSVLRTVLEEAPPQEVYSALFPLIQIRAVQSFSPSEALSFVFLLKSAVRNELRQQKRTKGSAVAGDELDMPLYLELDTLMDSLLALAFDIYDDCRQRIHKVKEDEIKRNVYMMLRKSGMVNMADDVPSSLDDNSTGAGE